MNVIITDSAARDWLTTQVAVAAAYCEKLNSVFHFLRRLKTVRQALSNAQSQAQQRILICVCVNKENPAQS